MTTGPEFLELLKTGQQDSKTHKTAYEIGTWILSHPKDRILLATATPQDVEQLLKRVRELFGVSTKNVTIA